MPQLDYSTFSSQIFWLIVVFFILYLFISKKFIPAIFSIFEDRYTRINRSLDYASKIRDQAKAKEEAFTSLLNNARAKASDIIEKASEKAANVEKKSKEDLEKEVKVLKREFEEHINGFEKNSKENVIEMSSDITISIVKKILDTDLSYEDAKKSSLLNYKELFEN